MYIGHPNHIFNKMSPLLLISPDGRVFILSTSLSVKSIGNIYRSKMFLGFSMKHGGGGDQSKSPYLPFERVNFGTLPK